MKFLRNLLILLFSDAGSKIISFFVIAYFARVLHPEGLGTFLWVQSLIYLISVIPNYGLNEYGILKIAPDRSRENIVSVVGKIIGARIVLATLTLALFLIAVCILPLEQKNRELLLLSSLFLLSIVFSFEWFYTATEDQVVPGIVRIVSRSMFLAGSLLFVHTPDDIQTAIILFVGLEGLLQLLLAAYYNLILGYQLHPILQTCKSTLRNAAPLAVYSVNVMVFTQADVVIIGFFLTLDAVGQFAGALRVVFLVMSVKYVVAQLLYPKVVYRNAQSSKALSAYLESLHTFTVIGALIVFSFLISFSDQIITLILGPSFIESRLLFAIMSIGLFAELCWIAFPYSVIAANQKIYSIIMVGIGICKVLAITLAAWTGNIFMCAMIYALFNLVIFLSCFLYLNARIVRLNVVRMVVIPLTVVAMAIAFSVVLRGHELLMFGSTIMFGTAIISVSEKRHWNRQSLRHDFVVVTK